MGCTYDHFLSTVNRFPQRDALIMAPYDGSYRRLSYQSLCERTEAFARGCLAVGMRAGQRVLFWSTIDEDSIALLFAFFKLDIIPVFLDPAAPPAELAACLTEVQPEGFVGIPLAHLLRFKYRKYLRSLRFSIVARRASLLPGLHFGTLLKKGEGIADRQMADAASQHRPPEGGEFMVYTTGTTGKPKGVLYSHAMAEASCRIWNQLERSDKEERDCSFIPVFSLFQLALGVTAVLPPLKPGKPLAFAADKVLRIYRDLEVTRSFASPRVVEKLAATAQKERITLPALKVFMLGGSTVDDHALELAKAMAPNGEAYVFYGATEAMPISLTSLSLIKAQKDVVNEQGGRGFCVGKPFAPHEARIVAVSDPGKGHELPPALPPLAVGELLLKGPAVSTAYWADEPSSTCSVMREGPELWHRMGDLAYADEQGNIYLCGRVTDRLCYQGKVYLPGPVERLFLSHPRIFRTALIPGAAGEPVLAVEALPGSHPETAEQKRQFQQELSALAEGHPLSKGIAAYFFAEKFPVDSRHAAKINRRLLRAAYLTEKA